MKIDLRLATISVLVFTGVNRMIEVLNNFIIKPNIPDNLDPQERDAIRLFVEIVTIALLIFTIKKFT